jgi:hypothetical protein
MPMYGMELRNKCRTTVANAEHNFNKVHKNSFIQKLTFSMENLGQAIVFHTAISGQEHMKYPMGVIDSSREVPHGSD